MKNKRLAIIGVTGLVGQTVLKVLEEKRFSNFEYELFASKRSKGKKVKFMEEEYEIQELTKETFNKKFDYAIFVAGGEVSKKYAPIAVKNGTIVIDNSSYFRMNKDVPLVVPEVNVQDIKKHKGIIANPNCSTIQAVVALKPLDDIYKIKRIVYSTYQAVSGAGQKGIKDLEDTLKGLKNQKFPYPIANNCIPQIDSFTENGYTKEELKMINETRKILNNPDMKITATTVRVPVLNSHSESINIEFEKEINMNELKKVLSNSPSIVIQDDIEKEIYPLATNSTGTEDVYIGRLRRDDSVESGINMWVVADNIRKGAASNAIQILEKLIEEEYQYIRLSNGEFWHNEIAIK